MMKKDCLLSDPKETDSSDSFAMHQSSIWFVTKLEIKWIQERIVNFASGVLLLSGNL